MASAEPSLASRVGLGEWLLALDALQVDLWVALPGWQAAWSLESAELRWVL